jgi:hypothetical protein
MTRIKRTGRCVCGIKVSHHFDLKNRKMSCDEARRIHPRAHKRSAAVQQMFIRVVPKETE